LIIIPKVFSATSDYSDKVFVSLTRSPLDCSLFFLPDERDKCCSFHAEVEEHAHASNGHGAEDPEDGSPAEEGHDRVVKQHADQTGHREPDEEQCVDFDAQAKHKHTVKMTGAGVLTMVRILDQQVVGR